LSPSDQGCEADFSEAVAGLGGPDGGPFRLEPAGPFGHGCSMRKIKRASDGRPGEGQRESRSGVDHGEVQALVGSWREGDGVDPREEAKRRRRTASRGRAGHARGGQQQERFFGQVQKAIDSALQAAATPLLNELSVREVVPEGGALLVIVAPRDSEKPLDLRAAGKAIAHATSMLRREVASTITRKETPNLKFVVLPAGADRIEE
jgi:hypothetical protein